ncbi:unnamed protein product [Rangifer tarandus platyrhynchus]|uniref:Uncharacterized protein n=1 Tax=Rangifer tarandus platyrhynchus TaxID=3082113 RepID=A0ABN8XQH3_RANTA|nr:unnamed protein product [Rangifer tarandus platyrhynchus]
MGPRGEFYGVGGPGPDRQLALRGSRSGLVLKAEAQRLWSPFASSSQPDIPQLRKRPLLLPGEGAPFFSAVGQRGKEGAADELGSRPAARGPRPGPGWRRAAWAGFASSRGPAGDARIPAKKRPRSEPTSAPACERELLTSVAAARLQGRPEPAFPRSESASAWQGPRPAPPFAIESPRGCGREPGVLEPGG